MVVAILGEAGEVSTAAPVASPTTEAAPVAPVASSAAFDVIMPQMGESVAEGTIVRWLKKVGDTVDRDEPIFEITTDKVDAEIPAPEAGVLLEILTGEGETVEVGVTVARIGEPGAVAAPTACSTCSTCSTCSVSTCSVSMQYQHLQHQLT